MRELKKIEQYSDDAGNKVLYNGEPIEKGISVRFKGSNNTLIVKEGSQISDTMFMFDCDDGICEIGKNSFRGTIRIGERSRVSIGDDVTVVGPCYISALERSSVTVGNDCMLSAQNEIRSDDAHPIFDVKTGERVNLPRSIRLGNHVWVQARAVILGGSEVGDGSVVGHSSVLRGVVPNNAIAEGSPAQVVRTDCIWERPHLSLALPHYKPTIDVIKKSKYWRPTAGVAAAPAGSSPKAATSERRPARGSQPPPPAATQPSSSHKKEHPYSNLPDRAFWRRAVGTRNPLTIADLYRKKFLISPEDRIVTAGSCFAQHIARRLKGSGFNFCDYEPAPPLLAQEKHQENNYGVYSARYCNIYTVRQLLQTFERAYGMRDPKESIWHDEDGYRDAFRPVVEPTPFSSEKELIESRSSHLGAVKNVFEKSDLFVFTLGLTEAWVSKLDGSVYPMCPGTAGGTFDPQRHEFKNFNSEEIYADMMEFLGHLRRVNPSVKVLLTISPVPLTATKADENVMVATMYSKSVLRGVAGRVASENDFVDYFPSYEIIAAPPMRGMFFEPNMRSVSPAGVDFVMSHFFAEHRPNAPVVITPAAGNKNAAEQSDGYDEVCEQMLLDQGL
jgi:acetyltransferase-like isoleucine patch superfamily enzyme